MEQEDRGERVAAPPVGILAGQPAGRQAQAVTRAESDDLAAERVEGGRQRRLIRCRSRRIQEMTGATPGDGARRDGRGDRRQRRGRDPPDHGCRAASGGSASSSNTSRLQVSIRSVTAATSARSAKAPINLSVSRMATGRPSASDT